MSISHNKKKNTALLFEFLTIDVSRSLVTGDEKRAKTILKLIEKYFKPHSELFKEYRLARSLIMTKGINDRIALKIIQESCDAIKTFNVNEVNEAKRKLVRDIHYKLGDDVFDSIVSNYKMYATIHQLFELWRKSEVLVESCDITKKSELESVLINWLVEEEKTLNNDESSLLLSDRPIGIRRLVIKKMMEKLNKKYSNKLTERQKKIVKNYSLEKESDSFKQMLKEVRDEAKVLSEKWIVDHPDDTTIGKLKDIVVLMVQEDYDNLDQDSVVRHMSYTSLIDEFRSEE